MKNRKKGFGSGKTKRSPENLRIPKMEENNTMLCKIRSDVYDYTLPVDLSADTTIKKKCLKEARKLLKTYGGRCLVNSKKEGFTPDGADRLSFTLYLAPEEAGAPVEEIDTYLARQKEGIPLKFFLAYVKGKGFVSRSDMGAIRARLGITSAKELEDAYLDVVEFLHRRVHAMHRAQTREPIVPRAGEASFNTNVYGDITVHYYG